MTNTTLTADSVSGLSPATASYRWEVPEKGMTIHLCLDVVDRMEKEVLAAFRAVTSRGSEVGGILLGRYSTSGRRTVLVESYEAIECDYSRGPLYLLGDADKQRLTQALGKYKGPGTPSVVGLYRSNTRREILLDEEDAGVVQEYFSDPHNVVLLVKPFSMKPSQGGFWFWEGGDIRTGETHLAFPFKRAELEKNFARFIVQPSEAPAARPTPTFSIPRREEPAPAPELPKAEPEAKVEPTPAPPPLREERPAATPVFKRPEPAAPVKREERPAAPPLNFRREDRPSVLPLPKREAAPAPVTPKRDESAPQPISIKREERPAAAAPAPPKREEKPAITLRREEKPAPPIEERPAAPPAKETKEERSAPAAKAAPPKEETAPKPEPAVKLETPVTIALPEPTPGFMARLGALKWVIIALLVVGLAGGGYMLYRNSAAKQVTVMDALALKVEPSEGKLVLSWNRNCSLIAAAQRATLTIVDGDHKEDADLDLGQLRNGRIEYWPVTNDVSFRLEVADLKHGKSQSESVRVLGRPSPTSTPLPQTAVESQQLTPAQQQQQPPAAAKPDTKSAQTGLPASAPAPEPPQRTVTAPTQIAAAAEPPKAPATPVTTTAPRADSLAARLRPAEPLPEPPRIDSEGTAQFAAAPVTGAPLTAAPPPQPPPPAAQSAKPAAATAQPATPVRVGGVVQEARPVRKVLPNYPPLARQARVTGVVKIQATIGADGRVKRAIAIAGPPLLRQAAVDSVLRWSYEPGKLNGKPVETTTQVDVIFAPTR